MAQLYSPAQCPNDCRGKKGGGEWALAKDAVPPMENEHHPMCKFAKNWASTLQQSATGWVIYDLDFSRIMREAAPSEIAESEQNERRMGVRQVTIADRVYAVLTREDAEGATLEARGEAYDGAEPDIAEGGGHLDASIDADAGSDEEMQAQALAELEASGLGDEDEIAAQPELEPELDCNPDSEPELEPVMFVKTAPAPVAHSKPAALSSPYLRPGARAVVRPPAASVKAPFRTPNAPPTVADRDHWPNITEVGAQKAKEQSRVTIQTYLTRANPNEGRSA